MTFRGEQPAASPPLPELPFVERADVFKGDERAAHLTRSPRGVRFDYTPAWLSHRRDPVASTLPLTPEPVVTPGGSVPAFFAGLLPEGRRLTALRTTVKTSADDELSLLLAVGDDLVGDIRVVPEGAGVTPLPPLVRVTTFADVRFSELLASVGVRPDRVGLPGVQDKVSAAMINIPVTTAPGRSDRSRRPLADVAGAARPAALRCRHAAQAAPGRRIPGPEPAAVAPATGSPTGRGPGGPGCRPRGRPGAGGRPRRRPLRRRCCRRSSPPGRRWRPRPATPRPR